MNGRKKDVNLVSNHIFQKYHRVQCVWIGLTIKCWTLILQLKVEDAEQISIGIRKWIKHLFCFLKPFLQMWYLYFNLKRSKVNQRCLKNGWDPASAHIKCLFYMFLRMINNVVRGLLTAPGTPICLSDVSCFIMSCRCCVSFNVALHVGLAMTVTEFVIQQYTDLIWDKAATVKAYGNRQIYHVCECKFVLWRNVFLHLCRCFISTGWLYESFPRCLIACGCIFLYGQNSACNWNIKNNSYDK